jgi:hypothetical protein
MSHQDFIGVDAQILIESDAYHHTLTGQLAGDTIAITAHINIAIPPDMSYLAVGGIVTLAG